MIFCNKKWLSFKLSPLKMYLFIVIFISFSGLWNKITMKNVKKKYANYKFLILKLGINYFLMSVSYKIILNMQRINLRKG
jgi:hypothetical protein